MPEEIYDTKGAAQYLKLSVPGIKYHIYQTRLLKPDGKVGPALQFHRSTLNNFRARRRKPGRPKKGQ